MKLNLEKINKKNICFIGLMGSGKTVIGKLLSKDLGLEFYDSDDLIVKKLNKSINNIFLDHGESYFRIIEKDIVMSMLDKKNCVISLGGGSILNHLARKSLKNNSYTVYLKVDLQILYDRIKKSKKRPLLNNVNIKEKLIQLSKERQKYYNKANLIIDNSNNMKIH